MPPDSEQLFYHLHLVSDSAKTAQTSAVRDLPTTHLTRFSSLARTRMAALTITAGRTGTASCQRANTYSIRLAGPAMIFASLIRQIRRACAHRRASPGY